MTFVAIVYLYELYENRPVAIFTIEEDEMENRDWLVEALVRALPEQDNFGWNGAHVLLTSQKQFDIRECGPHKEKPHEDDLVFTNEEIYDLFLQSSKHRHLEQNQPV